MKLVDYDGVIHNLFDYAFKHHMREESGYIIGDIFTVEDRDGTAVLHWTQEPNLTERLIIEMEFDDISWHYLPLTRVMIRDEEPAI